jgi:hypothetical protein
LERKKAKKKRREKQVYVGVWIESRNPLPAQAQMDELVLTALEQIALDGLSGAPHPLFACCRPRARVHR